MNLKYRIEIESAPITSIRQTKPKRVIGMKTGIRLARHVDIATTRFINYSRKFTSAILKNAYCEAYLSIKINR